jgi:zeaxanthin glucosyltransferase
VGEKSLCGCRKIGNIFRPDVLSNRTLRRLSARQRGNKRLLCVFEPLEDVQAVLSVGKNISPENLVRIPSNTIVVRSAPQIELLRRAALGITHAGLNTVLESLARGVPMVAIPIGYDQPGVAARIAHHGVGEFMEVEDLTVEGLSKRIQAVPKKPALPNPGPTFR